MKCTRQYQLRSSCSAVDFDGDEFPKAQSLKLKADIEFDLQRFAEGGDKTEEPTAKKREDARKKGQVAKSQELNAAFVLLMGFLVLRILWEYIYVNIAEYTTYLYSHLAQSVTTEGISELFIGIMILLARTVMPIMFAILIIGLAVNLYQVGFMFSTEQ